LLNLSHFKKHIHGVHQRCFGIIIGHIHELYVVILATTAKVTHRFHSWFVERWYHHRKRIINGGKNRPHDPTMWVLECWIILTVELRIVYVLMATRKKHEQLLDYFTINVIKDCPYNYGRIVQVLWKESSKKKNLYFEGVWNDAMWPLTFYIVFEPLGIVPLKIQNQWNFLIMCVTWWVIKWWSVDVLLKWKKKLK
jgi:hypothetical protein